MSVPPCQGCPPRSAPRLLCASSEGVPNPSPRAGAGSRVLRHVPRLLPPSELRGGSLAASPCPPLLRTLLRMGHGHLPGSPHTSGVPPWGTQTPSRNLARRDCAEICETAGGSHFHCGRGELSKFFRHLRIGMPLTLVGKRCYFQQSGWALCPELGSPADGPGGRPAPRPEHRTFARPRGWARLARHYPDDYFCLLPANA